jgi:hypothetical protein
MWVKLCEKSRTRHPRRWEGGFSGSEAENGGRSRRESRKSGLGDNWAEIDMTPSILNLSDRVKAVAGRILAFFIGIEWTAGWLEGKKEQARLREFGRESEGWM